MSVVAAVSRGALCLASLVTGLLGCVREYHPSSLPGGDLRTMGCLDLSFSVAGDARIPDDALLLDVHIGNRCPRPVSLDLTALVIDARDADGHVTRMRMHDPRNEIQPFTVDASIEATELIQLDPEPTAGCGELVVFCFDLSRVAPDTPAASPTPLCVRRRWSVASEGSGS